MSLSSDVGAAVVRRPDVTAAGAPPDPREPVTRLLRDLGDDGGVRLEGYRSQRANTVDVIAAGQRVILLVVAPEASAPAAHAVLMAAGHRGNTDDIPTLLRSRPPAARATRPMTRSTQR